MKNNVTNKENNEMLLDYTVMTVAYFICIGILIVKFFVNNIDVIEQVRTVITLFALLLGGMLNFLFKLS